ncbi:MAG: CBS domain-containing protein [Litorilinea sp.]
MSASIEVILTHEHTDFDALASLLGAALLYPQALPVLPRRLNRNVHGFLALYRNHFPFITHKDVPVGKVTRAILVDSRAVNWVRGMDKTTTLHIIDHHIEPEATLPRNATLQSEAVGANTTLLLEALLQGATKQTPLTLTAVQATLLALGIHEDTGSLTYPSTTHRDARCLAWLLEPDHGVNQEVVARFLNHPLNADQRALLDQLINNSDFHEIAGHTVVIAHARAPGYNDELSALVGRLRNYHETDAILMVVELDDVIQIVARSLTDDIDVGKIATAFGGGGHIRAAAAPVSDDMTLEAVVARVLHEVRRHARPAVTVGQIMSVGRPQSLDPTLSVQQAALLMSRYGHEGFPVIEKDAQGRETVLGVLTRREADRALNHKLGDHPVTRFMRAGSITISAEASIGELRKLMTENNWGQIPVVDAEGHITGIVTRTDLIKLWDETTLPTSHAPAISEKLQNVLTAQDLALLHLIGAEIENLNYTVYVVGGFVRDLLLNHTTQPLAALDMDIVIEGDAIAFARRMEQLYGGRVVPHRRFNTAKWIFDDPDAPVHTTSLAQDLDIDAATLRLPAHLDFVAARTEFYTAPTALPTVEEGSIKLDLHRRDFTVNTLAICLNPARWGELLDFYGGLRDLEDGVLRVLHSLSFVDDPTRILRAVRYEQRFEFKIEPRSLELLHDATELLDRVTPARIRHEFERIFQESAPARVLQRLDKLAVLSAIQPRLTITPAHERWFDAVLRAYNDPASRSEFTQAPLTDHYWGILAFTLDPAAQARFGERLGLQGNTQHVIQGLAILKAQESALLEPDVQPSQVAACLDPVSPAALSLAEILYADIPPIRDLLDAYLTHWQQVEAHLDGTDLLAMGIAQGPVYRTILSALRNGRMDGHIRTRAQAEQLARRIAGLDDIS